MGLHNSIAGITCFHSYLHQVTVQYIASSEAFHQNHVPADALMYFSDVDPISCPKAVNSIVEKWQKQGKQVVDINFGDSPHVGHFRAYPEKYRAELEAFIDASFSR
jgi:hypothetical protein